MDFSDEQHTLWYPGSEKPGEDGLYKRRKANADGEGNPGEVMYCLWQDGWWYEGSIILTSALNTPLRKSHYQPGHWEDFEWCGVMPGSYERPDVQAVKTDIFASSFFDTTELTKAIDNMSDGDENFEPKLRTGDVAAAAAQIETPPAPETVDAQFAADFFGEQP